jgi:hypothetical protein
MNFPESHGRTASSRQTVFALLMLLLATTIAYLPVFRADFVNFDDPENLLQNPHVHNGLTGAAFR